jgi:capsular polysaccharide biosynthesis protein
VGAVQYLPAGTQLQVQSLIAASPAFAMPQYADLGLAEVWSRISGRLVNHELETPERIFISRRDHLVRVCLNVQEIEDFFLSRGFVIIYPEDHPFVDQVTLFAKASIVAGFGGSGMFNMMYGPSSKKIVIAASSYTANNEWLMASVGGDELHYFWGESEVAHPAKGWSWEAFQSNFRFDLEANSAALDAIIESPTPAVN